MPDVLNSIGYDASTAGWMVFLLQAAIIPTTLVMPMVAEKMKNQVGLAIGAAVLFIIGFSGLLLGSMAFVPISAILLGVAGGSCFSLSMMFFTLRTRDGKKRLNYQEWRNHLATC